MTEEKDVVCPQEIIEELSAPLREEPVVTLPEDQDFAYRLRALRTEVLKCDWTCDKYLQLSSNKGYPYMSSDKCRRNLAPLIAKHGFEFIPEFSDLKREELFGNVTNHWSVKLKGTLYDAFTGRSISATVYGENGSSDDKGIVKAQTAAIKQWILSVFLLADGVDVDASEYEGGGTFIRKDNDEVRSKVLGQGIVPDKPAEPAKPNRPVKPTETVKPAKAPEKPVETPKDEKAEEPAPKAEEPQKPAEAPADGMVELPDTLASIHRNAIKKIYENFTAKAQKGEIDAKEYNEMTAALAEIKDVKAAVGFIKKYQE